MPIILIGAASGVDTATMPAHQSGDLLLVVAQRVASSTIPTLVAGWTGLATANTNTLGWRIAWRIAASSSEMVGTWTNAQQLIVLVYRGTISPHIGATAFVNGTGGGTVSLAPLTLGASDGSRWVVGFAGARSSTTGVDATPSGMTGRTSTASGTGELAAFDTGDAVSSWSGVDGGNAGTANWRTLAIELITDAVAGNNAAATSIFSLTGSGAASLAITAQGAGALPLAGSGTGQVTLAASASGALPLTGTASASGQVSSDAAASGTLPLGGTAQAGAGQSASASGGIALTGSVAAALAIAAQGAGALGLAGASSAALTIAATAAGSIPLAGSASAGAPGVTATAAGGLALSGSGAISIPIAAASTGGLALAGAGEVSISIQADASSSLALSGEALLATSSDVAPAESFAVSTESRTFAIPAIEARVFAIKAEPRAFTVPERKAA